MVFSLFLVFLFNTISPNTARINYTLGVLLASIGRSFFHNAVSQTWNVGPVSLGAFYLLLPAYSTFLLRFLLGVAIRSYKRKNALNPKTLEQALSNVQKTFHGLMAEGHRELSKLGSDPILDRNVLKKSLEELELTVSGLKRVLDDTSKE
ncbi:hypothetical protein CH375_19255 [Leptospira ellisii]|uniref:Uncharacterized protein n=1 Tax=Leptospira ellisii TaxID=2023197 RepID=A0A2N0BBH8_9LEPT|nr:hypothetical protein CH379_05490 [Leptospira ellisii]PKA03057.1 hypothetical protein CH375_19255 [Leptospira ellisii]